MDEDEIFMRVHTGLELTAELAWGDIGARVREHLALMQLGRAELAYLVEPGIVERCRPALRGNVIDMLVPLPTAHDESAPRARASARAPGHVGA